MFDFPVQSAEVAGQLVHVTSMADSQVVRLQNRQTSQARPPMLYLLIRQLIKTDMITVKCLSYHDFRKRVNAEQMKQKMSNQHSMN